MSDLITDDMIHVALRASDSANEGGVVGGRERMMRAAIEAVAPAIAAKALEDAADGLNLAWAERNRLITEWLTAQDRAAKLRGTAK